MFSHILVPLDGSPLAEGVLPHVIALAQAFESRITLLQVLEDPPTNGHIPAIDPLDWQMAKAKAETYLDQLASRLQATELPTEYVVLEGHPARHIIGFVRSNDVDLVALSSHGQRGLTGWNVSSVSQKTVMRAHVSMLITRAYRPVTSDLTGLRYGRILIPLDGSQRAESVLSPATTLARFYESQLLLAHVVCRPEMPRRAPLTQEDVELADRVTERNRQAAADYLEQLQSRVAGNAETRLVVSDEIAVRLHELAENEGVDLVVLSAHGYSGQSKWPFGRVTTNFIFYGSTPLLIVQDLPAHQVEPTAAEVAAREYKGH